jgi:hypothetical protein
VLGIVQGRTEAEALVEACETFGIMRDADKSRCTQRT